MPRRTTQGPWAIEVAGSPSDHRASARPIGGPITFDAPTVDGPWETVKNRVEDSPGDVSGRTTFRIESLRR